MIGYFRGRTGSQRAVRRLELKYSATSTGSLQMPVINPGVVEPGHVGALIDSAYDSASAPPAAPIPNWVDIKSVSDSTSKTRQSVFIAKLESENFGVTIDGLQGAIVRKTLLIFGPENSKHFFKNVSALNRVNGQDGTSFITPQTVVSAAEPCVIIGAARADPSPTFTKFSPDFNAGSMYGTEINNGYQLTRYQIVQNNHGPFTIEMDLTGGLHALSSFLMLPTQ